MSELEEQVAGLRALADFLEAHPKVQSKWVYLHYIRTARTADEFGELCREIGSGTKGESFTADSLTFTHKFGEGIDIVVYVDKAMTCEKKVVGQKAVTKLVPPPGVELVEETVMEDIVEWVCPPSFLEIGSESA